MATTRNTYTGDGTTKKFGITFEYLRESDVKVFIDNVAITGFTFANATTLEFDTISSATDQQETTGAPKSGKEVRVQRLTDVSETINTFFPGSAIRASDLNDNYLQTIFRQQELENDKLDNAGDTITGDLILDDRNIVIQEGADSVTITAPALSADRTLTIPDTTGTIVTTGDVNTVTGTMIGPDAINGDRIADDSVDSEHYVDGSIDLAHMSANSVDSDQYVDGSIDRVHLAPDVIDGSKLADNSVDSEHYVNGSIDREHLAADIVDGTKIDDNAIDSEHYVNGSIDREHLAADIIDGTKIDDDAINSEHYVDGSIDNQHIADHTIQYGKLQEISGDHRLLGRDSATNADVAEVQVATDMIADDQVTYAKMQDIATNNRVLGRTSSSDGTIVETQVVSDLIADDAVTDAKLADHATDDANRAVGTNHIKDNAVTSAKIAAGTIVNSDINDSAAIAGTKISMSLNQLSDVDVGTPGSSQDDQVLAWDNANSKFSLTAASGGGGLGDIVDDSSPQLGGDLDVQARKIFTSTGTNTNIVIEPKGTGAVNVSTSKIINVSNPTNDQDAATKKYVDDSSSEVVDDTTPQLGGDLDVNGKKIVTDSNNENVIIDPHGTGALQLSTSTTGSITTSGNNNLELNPAGTGSIVLAGKLITNSGSDIILEPNSGKINVKADITTTSNGNLVLDPNGTGNVELGANLDLKGNEIVSTDDSSIIIQPSGNGDVVINDDGTSTCNFNVKSNTNSPSIFSNGSNGRVGIGLNNPTQALDVSGQIHSSNNIVAEGDDVTITAKGSNAKPGHIAIQEGTHVMTQTIPDAMNTSYTVVYPDRAGATDQVLTITGAVNGNVCNLTWADQSASGGATGGGTDQIFHENGTTVTTNYTVGTTLGDTGACNAMSAGPITVNSGVTVTVNSGSRWVII